MSSYEVPGVCMGQCDALVAIGMTVSVNKISWVDSYLASNCTTLDDSFTFNVSVWKGVRAFSKGTKEILQDE